MAENSNFEIEKRVGTLETGLQLVSRDVQALSQNITTVVTSVGDFRRDWEQRTLEEAKTRQDLVVAKTMGIRDYVIMGSALIAAFAAMFGGIQYLIHSTTDGIQIGTTAQILQMTERLNANGAALNSVREALQTENTAIGDGRVAAGKMDDAVAEIREWKADVLRHDWPIVNATQTADIAANKEKLSALTAAQQKLSDEIASIKSR